MELDALDRQAAMAQAHDFTVLRLGSYLQAGRKEGALHCEGVVSGRHKMIFYVEKNPATIVRYPRSLAVHHLLRAHHLAAECLPDRLVSEADAQDGNATRKALDQGQADAGLVGRARPGGDDDVRRLQLADLVESQGVVPENR